MSYSNTFGHQHSTGKSTWHVEWCTKYRYKLFKSLYHKNICMIALDEAAKKIGIILLEKEVQPEHIHLISSGKTIHRFICAQLEYIFLYTIK